MVAELSDVYVLRVEALRNGKYLIHSVSNKLSQFLGAALRPLNGSRRVDPDICLAYWESQNITCIVSENQLPCIDPEATSTQKKICWLESEERAVISQVLWRYPTSFRLLSSSIPLLLLRS